MKFSTSINIERDADRDFYYVPTANGKNVINQIINDFKSGIHSFNIIGSYGTGKSSFILALERDLRKESKYIIDYNRQFNNFTEFEFVNVVGDYDLLPDCLDRHLNLGLSGNKNFFDVFDRYYQQLAEQNKFLFIIIDEFGKILEHAAKNNPEQELYFLQKFAEYVNDPRKNIILLSTLHQNFSSYSKKLNKAQRNEWEKVKGRFKEIVFNEPVEQLLYLAAEKIQKEQLDIWEVSSLRALYDLALQSKFLTNSLLPVELAEKLYPVDIFSGKILTLAIQQYGQNERSLFTFLESADLKEYKPSENLSYNLAKVYDYIVYNFYSYITEVHKESANWSALRVALERVEGNFEDIEIDYASRLVKTIGLLNIFAPKGYSSNWDFLVIYAQKALNIAEPGKIIDRLEQLKIIRFAKYKSQYIIFAGTDVDLEAELLNAGSFVLKSQDFIDKLKQHFDFNIVAAKYSQYKTGTPRYFQFEISDKPITEKPVGELDGFVNLLFSTHLQLEDVIAYSKQNQDAVLYAYFKNTEKIIDQIFEIDKYSYVFERVVIDKEDTIARTEIEKGLKHEQQVLNQIVYDNLFTASKDIVWVFDGEIVDIPNKTVFNRKLSEICEVIYPQTPVFLNEMVNKHKVSGAISTARTTYLLALLENYGMQDLDFPKDKFPPEKSIYLSLLQTTGIHRRDEGGYVLTPPSDESFRILWNTCEEFLRSTSIKGKSVGELIKILQQKPFKLKQGFLEFWIPTYLIIKREDYALYYQGAYVPYINKNVIELFQRYLADFTVKAFAVEGVRLDLFNKYREAINLRAEQKIGESSFIETIRPFLTFYKRLNEYAQKTRKLQKKSIEFRNVLAGATDPEKTFFEDLPNALGFKEIDLINNPELLKHFVDILQDAIRELRSSYSELLNRIEIYLLKSLGIKNENYQEYKKIITDRYRHVKEHLLPATQKTFFSRVMAPQNDRDAWLNSLAFVILNKPLESLLDEEEEFLLEELENSFVELANFVDVHKNVDEEQTQEVVKLDITTLNEGTKSKQVLLPKNKLSESEKLEKEVLKILSKDENVNLYTLIRILNKKIKR